MRSKIDIGFNSNGEITMYNAEGGLICRLPNFVYVLDYKALIEISINARQAEHLIPKSKAPHNSKQCKADYRINRAKWFTETHGITPSNAVKIIRGFVANEIVHKYPNYFKVMRGKAMISTSHPMLCRVEYEAEAEQAIKDGIKNIVPLIIVMGMTPQELKEYFGKSEWKKLCRNSYSRNLIIARKTQRYGLVAEIEKIKAKRTILEYNALPSSVINLSAPFRTQLVTKILKNELKIPYKDFEKLENSKIVSEVLNTVSDTRYALQSIGKEFNDNWSWRRIQEEHTYIINNRRKIEEERQRKYKEDYDKLIKVDISTLHTKFIQLDYKSAVAKPLTSYQSILDEADDMHHCVYSYAEPSARGNYLVYSITSATGERSTLGITVDRRGKKPVYSFQQHYLACNKRVTDTDVLTLAVNVVQFLNS